MRAAGRRGDGARLLPAARALAVRSLALLATLPMPIAILVLIGSLDEEYHPAAHLGAAAWPAVLAVHLAVLRWLGELLPRRWPSGLHVVGCWLGLAVLALEIR